MINCKESSEMKSEECGGELKERWWVCTCCRKTVSAVASRNRWCSWRGKLATATEAAASFPWSIPSSLSWLASVSKLPSHDLLFLSSSLPSILLRTQSFISELNSMWTVSINNQSFFRCSSSTFYVYHQQHISSWSATSANQAKHTSKAAMQG